MNIRTEAHYLKVRLSGVPVAYYGREIYYYMVMHGLLYRVGTQLEPPIDRLQAAGIDYPHVYLWNMGLFY